MDNESGDDDAMSVDSSLPQRRQLPTHAEALRDLLQLRQDTYSQFQHQQDQRPPDNIVDYRARNDELIAKEKAVLLPKERPKSLGDWIKYASAHKTKSWEFINRIFEQYAKSQIPVYDFDKHLSHMADMNQALEWAYHIPHVPLSEEMQSSIQIHLGNLSQRVWTYYIKFRSEFIEESMAWWMVLMRIRKLAVDKLPLIHKALFTDKYTTRTIEQLILNTESNKEECWNYLISACRKGYVGECITVNGYRFCCLNRSEPASSGNNQQQPPSSTRTKFLKVPLQDLIPKQWQRFKMSEFPLSLTWTMLTLIHSHWFNLEWTPITEYFLLIIWHHLQRFAFDNTITSSGLQKLYDDKALIKDPKKHNGMKILSSRFLRDIEGILIHHLEVIKLHYNVMYDVIKKELVSIEDITESLDVDRPPITRITAPCGYINTNNFPGCRHFVADDTRVVYKLETIMKSIFQKKIISLHGIDADAAVKIYQQQLVKFLLKPGETEAVLAQVKALIPKPALIINRIRPGEIPTIATTTFFPTFSETTISIARGISNKYTKDEKSPLFTGISYLTMIYSLLTVNGMVEKKKADSSKKSAAAAATAAEAEDPSHINNLIGEAMDIERIIDEALVSTPNLSSSALASVINKKQRKRRKRQQKQKVDHNGQQQQQRQPIEQLKTLDEWFIICSDKSKFLIFTEHRLQASWKSNNRNYPRIIALRGEYWVLDQHREFFLITTDPLEALQAWYARTSFMFGDEIQMEAGLLSLLFEETIGKAYRALRNEVS